MPMPGCEQVEGCEVPAFWRVDAETGWCCDRHIPAWVVEFCRAEPPLMGTRGAPPICGNSPTVLVGLHRGGGYIRPRCDACASLLVKRWRTAYGADAVEVIRLGRMVDADGNEIDGSGVRGVARWMREHR